MRPGLLSGYYGMDQTLADIEAKKAEAAYLRAETARIQAETAKAQAEANAVQRDNPSPTYTNPFDAAYAAQRRRAEQGEPLYER